MSINFIFSPQQYVRITFNDLAYKGRVLRCIIDGGMSIYQVKYSDDRGDLKAEEFYEDELEAIAP